MAPGPALNGFPQNCLGAFSHQRYTRRHPLPSSTRKPPHKDLSRSSGVDLSGGYQPAPRRVANAPDGDAEVAVRSPSPSAQPAGRSLTAHPAVNHSPAANGSPRS